MSSLLIDGSCKNERQRQDYNKTYMEKSVLIFKQAKSDIIQKATFQQRS